jgi:hypothetical protein
MTEVSILHRFKDGDHSSVLLHCRKVRVRRTALKIWARRDTARWGKCFKALFGKQFGLGALLTSDT